MPTDPSSAAFSVTPELPSAPNGAQARSGQENMEAECRLSGRLDAVRGWRYTATTACSRMLRHQQDRKGLGRCPAIAEQHNQLDFAAKADAVQS